MTSRDCNVERLLPWYRYVSQSAGIVAGSLGALESIGKKTMDILSEGDPGETPAPSLH